MRELSLHSILLLIMKSILFIVLFLLTTLSTYSQISDAEMDTVDMLIDATPLVDLCLVNTKEDLRFMNKAPEKYSNYKQEFMKRALTDLRFPDSSHFHCDVEVEINCKGKAGNYTFGIEPRTFSRDDFQSFRQVISLVEALRNFLFIPATYLGEQVNSNARFRIQVKGGEIVMINR